MTLAFVLVTVASGGAITATHGEFSTYRACSNAQQIVASSPRLTDSLVVCQQRVTVSAIHHEEDAI